MARLFVDALSDARDITAGAIPVGFERERLGRDPFACAIGRLGTADASAVVVVVLWKASIAAGAVEAVRLALGRVASVTSRLTGRLREVPIWA